MKLNKIFTLIIIIATLFSVGCSNDEPQTEDSNIVVQEEESSVESEEDNQVENASEDEEEVVEYFEAEDEEIDLGELI